MKTLAETKFQTLVKDVFQNTLKPLGFKKKGNNFYLGCNGFGKIINLQKSSFYSKEHINFTINTGLFSPQYWDAYYTYPGKILPDYPNEPECVIRRRIGNLLNTKDTWYDIGDDTDVDVLKQIQYHNLVNVILPYFNRINSTEDIIAEFGNERTNSHSTVAKLMILGELGLVKRAQEELVRLINKGYVNNDTVLEYCNKYKLKV
ncbi:DUF4304 domain-containing protein [Mucilaginibacter sp. AW1-3]